MTDLDLAREVYKYENATFTLTKGGHIIFTSRERGLRSLMYVLKQFPELCKGGFVADKVVGLAAAKMLAYIGVAGVWCGVTTRKAMNYLQLRNITIEAESIVENILAHQGQAQCDFELLTDAIENGQEILEVLENHFKGKCEMNGDNEETLVLIKPDAVEAGQTGAILKFYEEEKLIIKEMMMMRPTEELLLKHYEEHIGKPFLNDLLEFMQNGPVIALVLSGEHAVTKVRAINGATNPNNATSDTIRGIYGSDTQRNCVHGSASIEDAQREIALWFPVRSE